MPTAFVTTKQNQDSVTLSVDVNGSLASTSIFLNGNWVKTIDGNIENLYLGTNLALKNNIVVITTQVARFPSDMTSSTVNFFIVGVADVSPANPTNSIKQFEESAPNVPHFMTYYFN